MSIRDKRIKEPEKFEKDNFIAKWENEGEEFKITHATDVDPYLKAAKAARLQNFHENDGWSKDRNMREIAAVPPLVYMQWVKEDPEIVHNTKLLIKKLKEMKEKGLDYTTVDKI